MSEVRHFPPVFPDIRLTANFAHSVRNPLASIKMRLYSLGRLDLPAAQKDDLNVIIGEIAGIEKLIRNFLAYSRTLEINTELVSPSAVVDGALRMLAPDCENRRVRLELYRRQELPAICLDPEKVKVVLVNLVSNSIDAIENGSGYVFISEKEVYQSRLGPAVVIEVHDNGKGMEKFVRERLFEPFFTTKDTGNGLGLCFARQVVEAHGGTLTFSSHKNMGTVFTVTLPCGRESCRPLV